jgi:Bacterial cadherin-like domain
VLLNNTTTNQAPVAAADTYNTPEDTALTVNAPGVLGNAIVEPGGRDFQGRAQRCAGPPAILILHGLGGMR